MLNSISINTVWFLKNSIVMVQPSRQLNVLNASSVPERAIFGIALGLVIFLYFIPHLFPAHIGSSYVLASLALSVLSISIWRFDLLPAQSVLILSLLFCLCLFPMASFTSNDTERYLWDGAVALAGYDPYVIAPNNAEVLDLRRLWPTPEEHAQYPTLYPPGGLFLFTVSAVAGPVYGLWVWKFLVLVATTLTLMIIYKLLEHHQLLKNFALVGLSPLLLFETQIGGHLDIMGLLGISAALLLIQKDRILLAGIIIGVAATTKFLPALIVGPYLFSLKPKAALKLCLSSALTWFCIYGLAIGGGYQPLGLLPTFFEKWRGGAPLYPILEFFKDYVGLSNRAFLVSMTTLALTGFLTSAILARRRFINVALMLCLAVPLILSPILFPWYLLAFVVFLGLRPNFTLLAALTMSPLSYVVLDKWLSQGIWDQAAWPSTLLLLSLLLGLAFDVRRLFVRQH